MGDSPWFKTESVLCALVTLVRYDKISSKLQFFRIVLCETKQDRSFSSVLG